MKKIIRYDQENHFFVLFNKIELWSRKGSWKHPGEWVFNILDCPSGCVIIELGWLGFTWLRNECASFAKGDALEE